MELQVRRKVPIIDAKQFEAGMEMFSIGSEFYITINRRDILVREGDLILNHYNGRVTILSNAEFRKLYEPVKEDLTELFEKRLDDWIIVMDSYIKIMTECLTDYKGTLE